MYLWRGTRVRTECWVSASSLRLDAAKKNTQALCLRGIAYQ